MNPVELGELFLVDDRLKRIHNGRVDGSEEPELVFRRNHRSAFVGLDRKMIMTPGRRRVVFPEKEGRFEGGDLLRADCLRRVGVALVDRSSAGRRVELVAVATASQKRRRSEHCQGEELFKDAVHESGSLPLIRREKNGRSWDLEKRASILFVVDIFKVFFDLFERL